MSMAIFNSYVKLPEGNRWLIITFPFYMGLSENVVYP